MYPKKLDLYFFGFFCFFRDLPKHLRIGRLEETSPYVRRCWAKHKKTRDIATSCDRINSSVFCLCENCSIATLMKRNSHEQIKMFYAFSVFCKI